jgi:hypothetical protein
VEREMKARVFSVPCFDFKEEESDKSVKVTAIIAPIKITENGNTIMISWACSKGLSCCDSRCRYSKRSTSGQP